jgi:hypothetical protein
LAGVRHCSWDLLKVWLETATGNRIVLARGYSMAVHETLYRRIVEHLEFFTRIGFAQHAAQTSWTARLAPVPRPRWPVESEAERLRVRFPLEGPHPVAACLREKEAWQFAQRCGVVLFGLGLIGILLFALLALPKLSMLSSVLLVLGIVLGYESRRGSLESPCDLGRASREAARLTIALEARANELQRTDANGQTESWSAAQVHNLEVAYHHEPGGEAEDTHRFTLLLQPGQGPPHVLFTCEWHGECYDPDVVHAELSWLAHALKQRLHEESGRAESERIQSSLLDS